jgi:hypothetical protein
MVLGVTLFREILYNFQKMVMQSNYNPPLVQLTIHTAQYPKTLTHLLALPAATAPLQRTHAAIGRSTSPFVRPAKAVPDPLLLWLRGRPAQPRKADDAWP